MTDIHALVVVTETSLYEVAKQASALAVGLQNIAPGTKSDTPVPSVQYLLEIANYMHDLAVACRKLLVHSESEQSLKLHELIQQGVDEDRRLREVYQIGDKFRFIRDRIHTIFTNVEAASHSVKKEKKKDNAVLSDDEVPVFVYLFNAQGLSLSTWNKMVTAGIFYEHSVNRPIYLERAQIDAFINRKPNKVQHGYLTVIVNKSDIVKVEEADVVAKVKEGSLKFDKLVSFTHNGHDYIVNNAGVLVLMPKKS